MRPRLHRAAAVVAGAGLLLGALAAAPAQASVVADPGGTIIRHNVAADGSQLNGNVANYGISPDGRFAVFGTLAPELVPAGTGGALRYFVRDSETGTVEPAFTTASGEAPNGEVRGVSLSDGAEWVAFTTAASNMGLGAPSGVLSAYLFRRSTGEVRLISEDVPNQGVEFRTDALVTPDGRYVVLAGGRPQQIYRYDVATGDLLLVSAAPDGQAAAASSYNPIISADGTKVAFSYFGPESDLVVGGSSVINQAFVKDLASGTLTRFTRDADGDPLPDGAFSYQFSRNGRYLTFETESPGVLAVDTNNLADVFLWDLQSDTVDMVSIRADGVTSNGYSQLGQATDDGRTVAFISDANDLAPNDDNDRIDYFLKDMVTGDVIRVVSTPSGQRPLLDGSPVHTFPALFTRMRSLVSDGATLRLAFATAANNLVPGDTNGLTDFFTYDLAPVGSAVPTLSGAPQVGVPVSAQTPGWDGDATLAYQWLLGGAPIAGATSSTFTPTAATAGGALSVRVRGTRFAASPAERVSNAVTVAAAPTPPTPPATPTTVLVSSQPTIKGTARVGRKLRALPGTWTPGTTFRYQWRANGKAIKGATKATFKIKAKQRRARITVVVTGSNAGFAPVARTSSATRRVR